MPYQINNVISDKVGQIRDIIAAMETILAALPHDGPPAIPFPFPFAPSSAAAPFVATYNVDEFEDRKRMFVAMATRVGELGAEIAVLPPLVEGPAGP